MSAPASPPDAFELSVEECNALGGELARRIAESGKLRLDPDRVEQDLARLVLALMELLRQVVEMQAVRRMEAGRLTLEQEERLGLTLWRAKAKLRELAREFGLEERDLELRLQGVGRIV